MKKVVIILSIISIILIISVIVLLFNVKNDKKFIIPDIEKSVLSGIPNVDEEYKYNSMNVKDGYIISLAGKPKIINQKLYLYFTSLEENMVLFRLKVFYNGIEVGSTGLIEPGKYIESINLKEGKYSGKMTLKILGYENDTYQSAGTISLNLEV